MIKTIKKNKVYDNSFFTIYDNDVLFNNKHKGTYLKLDPKNVNPDAGGVMVMPITKDGKIIIQQEYRYGLGDWMYSFVAGFTSSNKTPEETALTELREEVQHDTEIDNINFLGKTVNTPNIMGDFIFLYYAENCEEDLQYKSEQSESFRNRLYLTPDEAYKMVMDNKILCGATQYMILKYLEIKNKKADQK